MSNTVILDDCSRIIFDNDNPIWDSEKIGGILDLSFEVNFPIYSNPISQRHVLGSTEFFFMKFYMENFRTSIDKENNKLLFFILDNWEGCHPYKEKNLYFQDNILLDAILYQEKTIIRFTLDYGEILLPEEVYGISFWNGTIPLEIYLDKILESDIFSLVQKSLITKSFL